MLDVPKMDDFAISLPQQLGMLFFVSSLRGGCRIESREISGHIRGSFLGASIQHGMLSTRLESLIVGFSACISMAPISLLEARKWFNPHKLPYWRMEQDYWMKESYVDPKSKDARFNSCSNPHLNIANVCNGRGSCLPFGDTGISFCRCNPGFGGAECESKRLSQITAWFLCLFLGPFGADQYYLGWYPEMIVTQMLSILGAALLISIPNSKLPGGLLAEVNYSIFNYSTVS